MTGADVGPMIDRADRDPVGSSSLGRHLHGPLRWTVLLSVAMNLLVLAPSIFMLQVFDRVLVSRSMDTLLVLLAGTALALMLLFVLDYVRTRLQGLLGQVIGDALMPAVAGGLIDGGSLRSAGASTALRDVATLRRAFAANGVLAVFDAPWLFVYVAVIALAHPMLGVTATIAAALMLGLALATSLLTKSRLAQGQTDAAHAQQWLEDTMRNAEVSRALGLAAPVLGRWAAMNERVLATQGAVVRRSAWTAALARTLRQSVQVGMLAVGAWLVIEQRASPGVMIATTVLLGRALAPVEQLVANWSLLVDARAAWLRLQTLLARSAAPAQHMALPAPLGRLEAHELCYQPPGSDRATLSGISLELAPGESMAIIGPSGSGKSTLARLLVGVWKPGGGIVRLDGVDLAQWSRGEVGPSIGYVPQDVQLFAGTVAENIARLGTVDSEKVLEAARRAGVHDMILALRDGYETVVEANSALISPGQRQRIALARALYGNPRLLVLDEPNASLDGDGEIALGEALKALRGEITVIAVTHRTSLVQHMDRLLVLDAGRTTREGPVAEVLAALSGASKSVAHIAPVPRTDRLEGAAR